MGTLTGCAVKLRKAGTPVRADDLAAMTARFNALTNAGAAVADAARQAVDEQIATVQKALQRVEGGPAPAESAAKAQAKADLMAGLGDLGSLLSKGTRANITPEEEQQLLPILTKVMDAAFRLGYLKFKDAAKFVLDQIRDAIGNDAADVITLQHVQGAYIGASSKYLDRGADPIGVVATFASLSDLGATAAAGVEAAADQVNPDSLGADTKNRANLNRAQLGGVQSSGEVGVDALRRVYGLMRSAAQDPQILKPIVSLVPVEVVDVLRGLQLSPEALFNDPSVLERLAGFGRNAPVPGGVDAALAVMKAAAAFAAKAPRATELAKGASDLDAAVSTLESRQSITPNSSVELGAESDATNSAPPILRPKNGGVAQPTAGAVENFGEALPPSRRQRLASLDAALSDDEIEAKPLSEIWPLAENDAIEDKFAAAVANTARASIPAKPRKGYKLDRWVDAVKVVRQLAQFITSGKLTREQFITKVPKTYALEGFMSKVALLDAIGREHWKRVGEVREHPGAYTFENGQKVPTPQVSVTIDGKHHWLRGGGSVADHIASVNELLGDAAPEKRMEFEVRGSGSSFGINKKGDSEYRRLMEFATADEAIKAKREKYADLVKAWDAVKDRDNVTERDLRSDENKDRIGPDYRKGRDISGDEFDSTFGFKGGEFGKWVSQGKGDKERQWMLNRAYDALMDLAGIVGVPPRAISLNGTLGIAFGSRGTGWASAHFEPGNLVINLTKTRGAGALAHEWFHALDNYFARARGGEVEFTGNQLDYRKNNYVTYKPEPMMVGKGAGLRGPMRKAELERRRALQPDSKYYAAENWQIDPKHPLGVRPEVEQRFADLVKALDEAPMTKRAAMIDKASGGSEGYWSRIIERAARSFESYVIYRMMEKGQSNEYLANVTKFQDFVRDKGRYPYPTPDEIKPVADAFGALFNTIQTRADDSGNVAMYEPAPPEYSGRYETDIFGDPLPEAARNAAAAKPAATRVRRNAQPEPALPGDTPAPAGDYHVRTTVGVTAQRRLGVNSIKSAADAAAATSYLYRSAVERMDGIVTDKNGKPLAVIGGFKGAISQASVYPATLVGEAVRIPGAAKVWFSHNHPSGLAELSAADEYLNKSMADAFRGSGIEPMGTLAIGAGKFGYVDAGGNRQGAQSAPAATSTAFFVPAIERELMDGTAPKAALGSPAEAKAAAAEHFKASGNAPGIILLNSQHHVVGWVPLAGTSMMGALRSTGGLNAIYRAVSEANAGAAIMVHGGELDAKVPGKAVSLGENIGAALTRVDVRALDIINAKDNTSAAEKGLQTYAGPVFRRGIAYAGDTTAIQQAVDVITDQWENAPPVTVVHSMQDSRLPQAIRDEDARQRLNGSTGEPTGVFFNGRVYIVASAVRNDAEVARVLFHEGLGHFGLRGAFGSSLDKILDQMATLNRPAVAQKAKEYGFDMANQAQRRRAAEEVLAELAETRPTSSWVQKAIAAIRTWLRENLPGVFGDMELSDAEIIRSFIAPARGFVERGQAQAMANATPVFTREPDSGIIRVVPIQLGSGGQTWVVTRNVYGQGSQHLGYFNTEQEARESADQERTVAKRAAGKDARWWVANPAEPIQSAGGSRLDSLGRAQALKSTLDARSSSVKTQAEGLALEQMPERAGYCYKLAAEASAAGLGDMVIGKAHNDGSPEWHAVVMRDGAIYDPTFSRWFEPGLYEALGFDVHTSLTPEAVRDFIARTGGMAPDSKNLKLDDEAGGFKDLTRLGEALAAQGYKRTDIPRIQASRKLAGLIKRLDEGKITPEAFEVAVRLLAGTMDRVVGIKTANRLVTERERGADILREKLIRARRTGDLDGEMVEFALWALDKNPDLASNLAISVRTPSDEDRGAAGDYNPTAEIIRLFKGSNNDDTAVHEILHHAERMMPPDMQAAIRKEWARALAVAIKRSTPEQVEALMHIGPALRGDRAAYKALIQSMNEGPLTLAHYQLLNPSEYWAVNGSSLLRGRFNAKDAVWKRIANWLIDMGEKLRGILGMQSDAPVLKALNYVTDYRNFGPERGGRFESEKMLSDRKTMEASGDVLFSRRTYDPTTTEALKRAGIGGPPSAREKIRAHWTRAMQLVTDRNELAQQMRQGTLDQFAGIQRAVRRDVGNLPAEQDPYIAARLANGGTSSVMRALLLHGQAQWAANGQHLEKKPGTRGLLDILKPLGDDVNDWFGWMVGNRAARLMSEGRENNFTADQIKALQALATPEKKAAFQKAAMEYTAFKRSVLDLAQAAGLINPESRKAWDHADYIPFYRQVDERSIFSATGRKGLSGQTSGIRTLKGGEAALNDPLENLLMNFSRLVDASLKNNAINRTIRALEEVDSTAVHKVGYDMTPALVPTEQVRKLLIEAGTHEAVMDAIPEEVFEGISKMWSIQQPTDPAVVRVMRGGKPVFYRVDDPLLLQSLTSFVPFDFPGLGMMRAAKRLLTATVTATPEFMLRNFIRDSVAAQAIARDGFNPAKSLQGIAKSFNESGGFESMLFAGASFQSGNVNAANPEATGVAIRRSLRSKGIAAAMAQNGFTQTLLDTGAKFWEKYREVGEAIENANREAVYEAATKEGKSPTAAAYEAKDLMDFSLRGSWAGYQLLADVLPFFNARVQGLYRVGRADPKRLATVGLMLTAASLMLAMANDGEDWYEELPDWDKDTYWHFRIGKQHFRIPKPFELGVIFATIPERIGRSIKGLDSGKKTGSRLWANVRDQLAFDPVPQLARPVLNVWANKDSFRDAPIESMSDEGKLPHLRYSARTSDTMRALTGAAPGLSDASGLSPKKLEYLLGGYLGTAGLYALALSDMLVRQLEGKPPGPSLRADDLPVVKAFYRVDPARATVFESDLYKMRAEVDAIAKSIKASAKDNPEEAARLQTTEKDKLAVRNMVVNAAKSITTLNRQRDQIYADKTMPPDEKRKQVDELQRKKNALAKQVAEHPMVKAAF